MDRPDVPLVDLTELADQPGSGAVWNLPHGGDLDANVVRVAAGDTIGEHVNDEVDVLLVVWSGDGQLGVSDDSIPLVPGTVVSVDRGERRSITAGGADLLYLSVHRRRGPLTIRARR